MLRLACGSIVYKTSLYCAVVCPGEYRSPTLLVCVSPCWQVCLPARQPALCLALPSASSHSACTTTQGLCTQHQTWPACCLQAALVVGVLSTTGTTVVLVQVVQVASPSQPQPLLKPPVYEL